MSRPEHGGGDGDINMLDFKHLSVNVHQLSILLTCVRSGNKQFHKPAAATTVSW